MKNNREPSEKLYESHTNESMRRIKRFTSIAKNQIKTEKRP